MALAAAVLGFGSLPGSAWADGDPASDVLVSQPLFLPQDAGVPAGVQAELGAILAAAGRGGYLLRVAVIASAGDLGSLPELFREPQNYARFLGQELSLAYRGRLLVVMPNGYGLYSARGSPSAERSALGVLHAPGNGLGTGTATAIRRLAAASGVSLPAGSVAAPAAAASSDTVAWVVFAIGAVLIAVAWIASLRARTPSLRARGISSG